MKHEAEDDEDEGAAEVSEVMGEVHGRGEMETEGAMEVEMVERDAWTVG